MKVVLAGGTGSLGRRLGADAAGRGDEVVILTRKRRADIAHRQLEWDGRTVGAWADELAGATVINLAGELVDRRPTTHNTEVLRRSRVEPTRALVAASSQLTVPPALWLQMSTLAIYGDGGQEIIDEHHAAADGPPQMAGVANAWEAAALGAVTERLVMMRTAIVLDRDTPAFNRLARLTRYGLGGRIGAGDQWVSRIHIDDLLSAVSFLRDRADLSGVIHLTAPEPVQNREMMASWRRTLHRPWSPPTPTPLVHLGALLMRTDPALALIGRRCVPRRLTDAGFAFDHPTLDDALADLATSRVPVASRS